MKAKRRMYLLGRSLRFLPGDGLLKFLFARERERQEFLNPPSLGT